MSPRVASLIPIEELDFIAEYDQIVLRLLFLYGAWPVFQLIGFYLQRSKFYTLCNSLISVDSIL